MYPYLYDEDYQISAEPLPESFEKHAERIPVILRQYLDSFDYADDSSVWFDKLRAIATKHNYAVKMGQYKKHPEDYNGSIADVSSFVRFALTGRTNTPDLHQIIHVLGAEEAERRVKALISRLQ
jgi:glutamyl-tRNA synthetase